MRWGMRSELSSKHATYAQGYALRNCINKSCFLAAGYALGVCAGGMGKKQAPRTTQQEPRPRKHEEGAATRKQETTNPPAPSGATRLVEAEVVRF